MCVCFHLKKLLFHDPFSICLLSIVHNAHHRNMQDLGILEVDLDLRILELDLRFRDGLGLSPPLKSQVHLDFGQVHL